jgi:hypothetical protein
LCLGFVCCSGANGSTARGTRKGAISKDRAFVGSASVNMAFEPTLRLPDEVPYAGLVFITTTYFAATAARTAPIAASASVAARMG